ncbi:MAG: hypothetical protein KDC54_12840 [Lewinella sp.]|nr:hypothetical protein [Lewinella sp.]
MAAPLSWLKRTITSGGKWLTRWGRSGWTGLRARNWRAVFSLRSWADGLENLVVFLLRAGTLALMLLFGAVVYHLMGDQGYVLEPFTVPKKLEEAGYDGQVIAQRIQDQVAQLKEEASSVKEDSLQILGQETADLSLPIMGVGLSLRSVAYQLREVLGRPNKTIRGEITHLDDTYEIQVRMTDYPTVTYRVPIDSLGESVTLDRLFRRTAEGIIGSTDPYRLALICYHSERYEEAVVQIRRMLEERSEEAHWAYLAWGVVLSEQGNPAAAVEKFQRANQVAPDFPLPYFNLASALHDLEDIPGAITAQERGLELDPDNTWQWNYLAWLYHLNQDYEASDQAYATAISTTNSGEDLRGLYMNWADKKMARRDMEGALALIAVVEDRFGEDADSYISRAIYALAQQDTVNAYRMILDAFELDPSNSGAINYASNGAMQLKDYGRVLDIYRRAQVDERNTSLTQNLLNRAAMAFNYTGQHDSALAVIQRAILVDPNYATPYTTLGEAYYFLGRRDSCYFYIAKALDLGFNPDALRASNPPYDELNLQPEFRALLARYEEDEADVR